MDVAPLLSRPTSAAALRGRAISTLAEGTAPHGPARVACDDVTLGGARSSAPFLTRAERGGARTEHAARAQEPATASTPSLSPESFEAAPKARWTVLCYHDGDSNLQPFIAKNLRDIKASGASDDVRLVVESSRPPKGSAPNVQRVVVGEPGEGEVVARYRADLQDPSTLTSFLTWGMKAYPAEHTLLVVGGHGSGYLGICANNDGETMSLGDFRTALDEAAREVGRKPDVLSFDACLMGQAEVLHSLQGAADVVVASEELVGGDGFPYKKILAELKDNPAQTPIELGATMVEAAYDDQVERLDKGKDSSCDTLAAYDMQAYSRLQQAMGDLATAIITSGVPRAQIARVATQTQRFNNGYDDKPFSDYRDVGDFARRLQASRSLDAPGIKAAAARVQTALDQLVIAEEHESEIIDDATGLSTWLPLGYKAPQAPGKSGDPSEAQELAALHGETDFAEATPQWTELLRWLGNKSKVSA